MRSGYSPCSVLPLFLYKAKGCTPTCTLADFEQLLSPVDEQGTQSNEASRLSAGTLIYDADRERILHLHALGVPLATIIDVHLKYGKYLSLKTT